ncbi:hypothetical protein ACR6C2_14700 [Streptomyces sp. INA 01156]
MLEELAPPWTAARAAALHVPSTSSGVRFSATPDAARTTSRPTSPSPA